MASEGSAEQAAALEEAPADETQGHGHSHSHAEGQSAAPHEGQISRDSPKVDPDDIFRAIKTGNAGEVKRVACVKPFSILETDEQMQASTVHWAALSGSTEILCWLIEKGVPPNSPTGKDGMRPIHWAATRGHLQCVVKLLDYGVHIDSLDSRNTTALIVAAQYDMPALVNFLVKQGADVSLLDSCDDNALHWAAYKGNVHTVGLLHYLGVPINTKDSYGSTPLHLAIAQRNDGVVQYLLQHLDPEALEIADGKDRTPMVLALERATKERGYQRIIQQLRALNPPWYAKIIGMDGGEGGKAMFYFVWINCTAAYITYYYWIVAKLPQYMNMHLIFFSSNFLMWVFFLTTWLSDPGKVNKAAGSSEYEQALEETAQQSNPGNKQLCHSCHIVKPLRSKHCSICKSCIHCMDHHCPYVNNCVAKKNYPFFFAYIFAAMISTFFMALSSFRYLYYVKRDGWVIFILVDYLFSFAFGISMVSFHSFLIMSNLTTNEHANWRRYPYLNRGDHYHNRFDRGTCGNVMECISRTDKLPSQECRDLEKVTIFDAGADSD